MSKNRPNDHIDMMLIKKKIDQCLHVTKHIVIKWVTEREGERWRDMNIEQEDDDETRYRVVCYVFIHNSMLCHNPINALNKNIDYLMASISWPFLKVAPKESPFLMKWMLKTFLSLPCANVFLLPLNLGKPIEIPSFRKVNTLQTFRTHVSNHFCCSWFMELTKWGKGKWVRIEIYGINCVAIVPKW